MKSGRIAVLGGGAWGTALAHTLRRNGHPVVVWVRRAELAKEIRCGRNERYLPGVSLADGLEATTELEEAVSGAAVLLLAVPSHVVREVLEASRSVFPGSALLISSSKGIEIESRLRMSEVAAQVLGEAILDRFVALSGPSFAHELARRLPTAVVAASRRADAARAAQALFQNQHLRIYTQADVVGVELGGALKNVIALAAGISDGLGLGSNARAALITRGLAEIVRLAVKLDAEEATLSGLAGIGDLVLTCTGELSRNRRMGLGIGAGRKPEEVLRAIGSVVEGFRTARAAEELSRAVEVEMPIVHAVYSILYEDLGPRQALAALMAREPKPERWS